VEVETNGEKNSKQEDPVVLVEEEVEPDCDLSNEQYITTTADTLQEVRLVYEGVMETYY